MYLGRVWPVWIVETAKGPSNLTLTRDYFVLEVLFGGGNLRFIPVLVDRDGFDGGVAF